MLDRSAGGTLTADLYYPASGGQVDPAGAPYPAVVFAHGFMSNRSYHSGNGQHLAGWGYVVAIPNLPDNDVEVRASDVQTLFSYLAAENARSASRFFHKIDVQRFGVVGHSLGGMTALVVAARDTRIRAAVALDPAGGPLSDWDAGAEAPGITAPFAIIGAPAQLCNNNAEYDSIYPDIGATHKARMVLANAGHCDFMDGEDSAAQYCSLFCGKPFDEGRLALAERYTAAWFNYYLHLDTDYYAYLYGDAVDPDVDQGRITLDVQTAPRNLAAGSLGERVVLTWTLYPHPIIAGYNIYRSRQSGNYPGAAYAGVGRNASYQDTSVLSEARYFYVIRSRDAGGNEHQASGEVSVVAGAPPRGRLLLPIIWK
jgi:dienelactone hydrolase